MPALTLIRDHFGLLILFGFVIATGATLMFVSQRVYDTQIDIQTKNRDLQAQEWELRTLKAEWAYLTRPDRLDQLAMAQENGSDKVQIVSLDSVQEITPVIYEKQSAHPIEPIATPVAYTPPMPNAKPAVKKPAVARIIEPSTEKRSGDFASMLKTIGTGQ